MHSLTQEEKKRGVVCASAGNHGKKDNNLWKIYKNIKIVKHICIQHKKYMFLYFSLGSRLFLQRFENKRSYLYASEHSFCEDK